MKFDEKIEKKFRNMLPSGLEESKFLDILLDGHRNKVMGFADKPTKEDVKKAEDAYWKRYRGEARQVMLEAFDMLFKEKEKPKPEPVIEPKLELIEQKPLPPDDLVIKEKKRGFLERIGL